MAWAKVRTVWRTEYSAVPGRQEEWMRARPEARAGPACSQRDQGRNAGVWWSSLSDSASLWIFPQLEIKTKQIYFYTPPTPALKPSWALEKDRWCSQKGLCSAVFLDGFLETGWRAGEKEAKPPCLTESHKWYAGVKWQHHCHSWWLSGTQKDRPNNHLEP